MYPGCTTCWLVTARLHAFWTMSDGVSGANETEFFKSPGVMGGLLMTARRAKRALSRRMTESTSRSGTPARHGDAAVVGTARNVRVRGVLQTEDRHGEPARRRRMDTRAHRRGTRSWPRVL